MINKEESEFVERFGLIFERLGSNRSLGRVIGWLSICDPPEQSAADIRDALQISQANVSTTMRSLTDAGYVERVSIPGKRPIHYRVPPGAWETMADRRVHEMAVFTALAELGETVMKGKPAAARRRVEELSEWAHWWRDRYIAMIEEWKHRR